MKRILFLAVAATVLAAGAGCCLDRLFCARPCGAAPCGCSECGCDTCGNDCAAGCRTCKLGCKHGARGGAGEEAFAPGPPTAAVTYPYYTTRGPRDFFATCPSNIGP